MSNVFDPSDPAQLQALFDRANAADAADARATAAQRQNELIGVAAQAGIPFSTKVGQAFLEKYAGEPDVEQMRSAAMDWGLWQAEGEPAKEIIQTEDAQNALVNGSHAPSPTEEAKPHPVTVGLQEFQARIKEGTRREDAFAEVTSRLIDAAAKGDSRVIWVPQTADQGA